MQKYGVDQFREFDRDDNGDYYAVDDVETLQADHAKEIEKWRVAEKEISDAYLRIRKLVGALDTQEGGVDRCEVMECAIKKLLAFWEWSRLADKMSFDNYEWNQTKKED